MERQEAIERLAVSAGLNLMEVITTSITQAITIRRPMESNQFRAAS